MKRTFSLLCVLCLLALCACGAALPGGVATTASVPLVPARARVDSAELQFVPPAGQAPVAVFETDMGTFYAVLYPEYAPLAVENFVTLANQEYYNNTDFHRVIKDFVVQGGDASGSGLSGASIFGAPYARELTDGLHHYAGALCVAAAEGLPEGGLSQFYIVTAPAGGIDEVAGEKLRAAGHREEVISAYKTAGGEPYLDYTDTVFGQVYVGQNVVDTIGNRAGDEKQPPPKAVRIKSVTITTADAVLQGDVSA